MMEQVQKQEQHLYQRQYLGLKVLQMNCADLEAYIREEASCNPLIDLADDWQAAPAVSVDDSPYEYGYAGAQGRVLTAPDSADISGSVDPFAETLERHLSEQLYYRGLTDEAEVILRYLIANLDEDGYFRQDPAESAERLGVSSRAFQNALSLLQSLDPPGIGAANLRECLTLQLERMGAPACAADIVKDYLPKLAKKQYSAISAGLGLPLSLIKDACTLIASLDPKPGSRFETPSSTCYVIPDVYCTCRDSVIRVSTRFQGKAPFSINKYYLNSFDTAELSEYRRKLSETASVAEAGMEQVQRSDEDQRVATVKLQIKGTMDMLDYALELLELAGVECDIVEDDRPRYMRELTEPCFDSFVCFDIETTGTFGAANGDGPAEITEIGAVKVINGRIVERQDWLCNPGRRIVPQIARLTHITDDMVADAPTIDQVLAAFRDFSRGLPLVGHNIQSSDLHYIERTAKKTGVILENEYFDTYRYAKTLQKQHGWENVKLETLSAVFGISQPDAHRAWCDAEANVGVYFKLKEL